MIDVPVAAPSSLSVGLGASKVIFWASLIALAVHAVAAVALGVDFYADGAWFDFALLTGEPYNLVWRGFPLRQTHYWFVYAPALGLLKLHAPRWAVLSAAHALWNAAPLASLAACRALAPRALLAPPAAFFAVGGLLTWGFPTEALLLAAFAWPAFYATSFGERPLQLAGGALAIAACGLTYEVWPAFAPLLVFTAIRRPDRRRAVVAVLIGLAGAGLLTVLALGLIRQPDGARQLISRNAAHAVRGAILGYPALWKQACIGLVMVAAIALGRLSPRASRPVLSLAMAAGVAVVVSPIVGYEFGRYEVRTVLLAGLWLTFGALLLRDHWPAAIKVPAAYRAGLAILLVLAVSAENLRFGQAWLIYRNRIRQAAACEVRDCGRRTDFAWSADTGPVEWPWGLPFRSWLMAPDPRQMIALDEPAATRWPSPLSCEDALRLTRRDADLYGPFLQACGEAPGGGLGEQEAHPA